MKINDFTIGEKFYANGGFAWLCTDKGTRTICAIMLEPDKSEIWFQGPPYSLNEQVFDEYQMKKCYTDSYPDFIELTQNLSKHTYSHHDVIRMMKEKNSDRSLYPKLYNNPAILRRDRVASQTSILHPYSLTKHQDLWYVKVFDIFNYTYHEILENNFILFPIAHDNDYDNVKSLLKK